MRRTMLLGGLGFLAACAQEPQRVVVVQQPATVVRPACDTSFRVYNASSLRVDQLYFSHSSLGGWGSDQLGQSVLPPGRTVSYRAANTGRYDFRVVWANGRAAELRGVNVCAASQITVTNGGLRAS
ncbi:hypothetical protein ACE7GA_15910 [Roseomonas sp. CCTCC AB2023176]|uniref:hypothetical protein n=1 Tax=Roseomonas sp. CCTCC AB2023176 TaxID=3342640 RepID=UPI0035DF9BB6